MDNLFKKEKKMKCKNMIILIRILMKYIKKMKKQKRRKIMQVIIIFMSNKNTFSKGMINKSKKLIKTISSKSKMNMKKEKMMKRES